MESVRALAIYGELVPKLHTRCINLGYTFSYEDLCELVWKCADKWEQMFLSTIDYIGGHLEGRYVLEDFPPLPNKDH